jgi:hypothetical protein
LVETRSKCLSEPDWADSVVRFLCGEQLPDIEPNSCLSVNVGQLNEFAALQRSTANQVFVNFDKHQAFAICEWLQSVESWKASNINPMELASALSYWKRRSE